MGEEFKTDLATSTRVGGYGNPSYLPPVGNFHTFFRNSMKRKVVKNIFPFTTIIGLKLLGHHR